MSIRMYLYYLLLSFIISTYIRYSKADRTNKNSSLDDVSIGKNISLLKLKEVELNQEYFLWFNSKSTCINTTTSHLSGNKVIYHLPTHEGLASQLHQLEYLWMLLKALEINKTIIQVHFNSHHYREFKSVSDCNVFKYPQGIECSCSTMEVIAKNISDCTILGEPNHWSTIPINYHLNNNAPITRNIDINKTKCIAGQPHALKYSKKYRDIQFNNIKHLPLLFQDKYIFITNKVISLLFHANNYIAVHWRRGDQLELSCKPQKGHYIELDHSTNCDSVDNFIYTVKQSILSHKDYIKNQSNIYIATNENNHTNINILHNQGYVTSKSIKIVLKPYLIKLTSLDIFMIELILMCKAQYIFYWGRSGIHDLITRCRNKEFTYPIKI